MSLSEDERRTLREMESALLREDPRFAAAMSVGPGHRRITAAVAVGFGVVIVVILMIACFGPRVAGVVAGVTGLLTMMVTVAILLPRRMIGGPGGQRATGR